MYYKMKLCKPKNLEIAKMNHLYYFCENGVFQQNAIEVVDQLIVKKSLFQKNMMVEDVTHLKFPLLSMKIYLLHQKYVYTLKGIENAPLFLFHIENENLDIPENRIFLKERATLEDRKAYQERNRLNRWKETLMNYQKMADEEEQYYEGKQRIL